MSFNPKLVQCLAQSIFIEVFIEELLSVPGPGGQKVSLSTGTSIPESYAYVHSVGPEVKNINVGNWILLKPMNKGGYEIKGAKYAFISGYEVEAIIPEEYKQYFTNSKSKGPIQPKDQFAN